MELEEIAKKTPLSEKELRKIKAEKKMLIYGIFYSATGFAIAGGFLVGEVGSHIYQYGLQWPF